MSQANTGTGGIPDGADGAQSEGEGVAAQGGSTTNGSAGAGASVGGSDGQAGSSGQGGASIRLVRPRLTRQAMAWAAVAAVAGDSGVCRGAGGRLADS